MQYKLLYLDIRDCQKMYFDFISLCLSMNLHYRIQELCRVLGALGKAPKTANNTRQLVYRQTLFCRVFFVGHSAKTLPIAPKTLGKHFFKKIKKSISHRRKKGRRRIRPPCSHPCWPATAATGSSLCALRHHRREREERVPPDEERASPDPATPLAPALARHRHHRI